MFSLPTNRRCFKAEMLSVSGKMSGVSECVQHALTPNHNPDTGGVAVMAEVHSIRRVSVRTRFEIFKRDKFTCRYCGRTSPAVVLEIDHIVPICEGGTDDPINLAASCWECNHGKSGVPLSETLTGEDPHDRAIQLLERERQLREYNAVLAEARERRLDDAWELIRYWMNDEKCCTFNRSELSWLVSTLEWLPLETIRAFMDSAIRADAIKDLRYVKGCVRNFRGAQGNG
jgi:5-methylcytosine-specific restriction endonuclease McrA